MIDHSNGGNFNLVVNAGQGFRGSTIYLGTGNHNIELDYKQAGFNATIVGGNSGNLKLICGTPLNGSNYDAACPRITLQGNDMNLIDVHNLFVHFSLVRIVTFKNW